MNIFAKIYRKWMKLRLQPIRVFCFHHVREMFDESSMELCDWMQMDAFKQEIIAIQKGGIQFISLSDAHAKISNDIFRFRKYAVLTADDGWASLKEILPWLEQGHIPITLFINGKYLDGKSYRNNPQEQYLTKDELFALCSPSIEIGSHGWEHTNASKMSLEDFKQSIEQNVNILSSHPCYVPFHAYTWGNYTKDTDAYLQSRGITPLYIDRMKNYNDSSVIHRELLTDN